MGEIYFGTDGWRAIIADKFTFENVRKISQAFSNYLEAEDKLHQGIAISFDTRFLSRRFARQIAEVLASNKIPVFLSQQFTPTPILSFAVRHRHLAGGMMVTASHNPYFYNGVKFKAQYGGPALSEMTAKIESYLEGKPPQHQSNRISQYLTLVDFFPDYFNHIQNYLDHNLLNSLSIKIVYDPMYGAGCGYLDNILQQMKIPFVTIHNHPDPYFGQLLPEPIPSNLSDLKNAVIDHHAQVGLATDGDADRFGVVDGQGNFVDLHDLMPLLFSHLVQSRGWSGHVARTTSMADTIDKVAATKDRTVHEVAVGFSNVTRKMLEDDILIGGEESGGFGYKNHIPERDGLLSCLLLLELLASEKAPLHELVSNLRQKYGPFHYGRMDKYFNVELLQQNMQRLRESPPAKINNLSVKKISLLDGIKLYLEDLSWILIRVSQTEPLVRIYVTSDSSEKVQNLLTEGLTLITQSKK